MDTSVFNALIDERAPARQAETKAFFARLHEFEASTSAHAREELAETKDRGRRADLLGMLDDIKVIPLLPGADDLAQRYVAAEVFSRASLDDAVHVAAAVLGRYDVLVSWNFRHLVNRRRRAALNSLNVSWGLPEIDIVAPPEL